MTKRRIPQEAFEFNESDISNAVATLERLAAANAGWANLQPGVRPEDEAKATTLGSLLFGGRGYMVPVCTWVSGGNGRNGRRPAQLGVQHSSGPRAMSRLSGMGIDAHEGWVCQQDHPRRGLVISIPADSAAEPVLRWLMDAARALSGVVVTGDWRMTVHSGRRADDTETKGGPEL